MKKLMNLVMMTTMALLVCSCGSTGGQQKENTTENESEMETEKYFSYQLLETHKRFAKLGDVKYREWDKCDWTLDYGNQLDGLVICYGDNYSKSYLLFDDEEDYYSTYIYEWALALKMAHSLYNANNKTLNIGRLMDIESENDSANFRHCTMYQTNTKKDTIITFKSVGCQEKGSWRGFEIIEAYAIDKTGKFIGEGDTILNFEHVYFDNNQETIADLLDYIPCMPSCIDGYKNAEIVELFKKSYYDLQDAAIYEPERGYGFRKYPVDMAKYGSKYVELYRIKEGEFNDVPAGALGIRFKGI